MVDAWQAPGYRPLQIYSLIMQQLLTCCMHLELRGRRQEFNVFSEFLVCGRPPRFRKVLSITDHGEKRMKLILRRLPPEPLRLAHADIATAYK